MKLADWWKVNRAAGRIATRISESERYYFDIFSRGKRDVRLWLREKYSSGILLRIDAYQKSYPGYTDNLLTTLEYAQDYADEKSYADRALSIIEEMTPLLCEVEEEFGDTSSPYYEDALLSSDHILSSMMEFLLTEKSTNLEKYGEHPREQYKRVIAMMFLLIQRVEYEKVKPGLPWTSNYVPVRPSEWLTLQAFEGSEAPDSVVTQYLERAKRREAILSILSSCDDVTDNVCDYSDDTIQMLDQVLTSDFAFGNSVMKELIEEGSEEITVRETLRFDAARYGWRAFTAAAHIGSLHGYPWLSQYVDLTLAPQQVQNQCSGLLRFSGAIKRSSMDSTLITELLHGWTITDEAVLEFIKNEPHRALDIAESMIERESTDIEFILSTRDGVMGNGTL